MKNSKKEEKKQRINKVTDDFAERLAHLFIDQVEYERNKNKDQKALDSQKTKE